MRSPVGMRPKKPRGRRWIRAKTSERTDSITRRPARLTQVFASHCEMPRKKKTVGRKATAKATSCPRGSIQGSQPSQAGKVTTSAASMAASPKAAGKTLEIRNGRPRALDSA